MSQPINNIEHDSSKLYPVLLEAASEGIVVADEDGSIRIVNRRTEELFGYSRSELIGQTVDILLPEAVRSQHVRHRRNFAQTPATRPMGIGRDLVGRRKDGSEFPIEVSLSPVSTDAGMLILAFVTDISERMKAVALDKQRELQLRQADKMASLGILVSGVAHEINNPNNFILLNGKIINRAWGDISPILEKYYQEHGDFTLAGMPYSRAHEKIGMLISAINTGSQRIERIVKNLKNFAREDPGELNQDVNLNEVVESAIVIVYNLIRKHTNSFAKQLAEDLPLVRGNFQQLEQVVINLITNACQALPSPERALTVRTYYDPDKERTCLSVEDEGMGIAHENLDRVMDPFFTTKQSSGGTGLGLSICYNITRDHRGTLAFTSVDRKGTQATMSIPILKQESVNE